MRTFKMQYIKNGRDGVMLVAAKDRWDAIGLKAVSDPMFYDDGHAIFWAMMK